MIDLKFNTIDLELFFNVLKVIKNRPEHAKFIMDCFSRNQFKSKRVLLEFIDELNLDKNSEVVVFGCWYGGILISSLLRKFTKITGIDLDNKVLACAKSSLFADYTNSVDFITGDALLLNLDRYKNTALVINSSCEHMLPMNTWKYWDNLASGTYFAFQSNNMFDIDGHINCVNSLQEFKEQLPLSIEILFTNELVDERGTRFTIVGKKI